ncbi:BON domain-containing protein [Cupriavidus sp. 30B13]|uniref:BON domain-containing protein n=1 Tax=Cupriavidus sp. 30B13 TaxID=3384241 RepID=UPI003B8F6C61
MPTDRDDRAQAAPQAGEQARPPETAEDAALASQVHAEIARACGDAFPQGVTMRVADRRVELEGEVEDAQTVQRIEMAASATPGLLGVQNRLRARRPAPPEPAPQVEDARLGVPIERPAGQVNHKV